MYRSPGFLCFLLTFFSSIVTAQNLSLRPQKIVLKKGASFHLNIPEGYRIAVAAEGLKRPRFFAKSPDGRLFVTDMYDRSDNKKGRVLILENWNAGTQRFEKITTYLDSLHNPNQVAFYTVGRQHFIYVAETHRLACYAYQPGEARPAAVPRVIATFPDYGLNYKYGGWHLTRSLAFHEGKLYVSVGSSCNACIEKEAVRATILEMNPDGSGQAIFASGLRNSVGIQWIGNELWASGMGRDGIGPDKPEDLFHTVKRGGYYGWPFYVQFRGRIQADATFRDSTRHGGVKVPPVAPWGFAAHSAPLGFAYLDGFRDTTLNHSFLVALHGSTSVWRQRGNAIVQLLPGGRYREVVTGFLRSKEEAQRHGRPCDVLQWDEASFFFSDDKNGVIYFVYRQ